MNTEHYKQKLEEEKGRLESEMATIGKPNPAVPGDWEPVPPETGMEPDVLDQADIFEAQDTNRAIFADLEARYDKVLAALERVDDGTFGVCSVCGAPIEEGRLEADLTAATCVAHLS